ncbi:hypothetical protein [uncultured Winogradskyella sp.]|uniref:DUF7672 family protein n=1 Tax=uncultured Winogradskyella sp. TaxID=395353 RepID=UPI0035191767
MIRLYIIGLSILLTAIIANVLANYLGLKTWYDFLSLLKDSGLAGFKTINVLDYVWLFVGYPLTLGFGYWVGQQIYDILF